MSKTKVATVAAVSYCRPSSAVGDRLHRKKNRHRNGSDSKNSPPGTSRFDDPKNRLESAIARYVDLYDFAPIAYVSFDRTGRIEEANLSATELLGLSRDLLIGRPFALFVADSDAFLRHLFLCRTSEQRVETELWLKPRKRKTIPAHLLSTPIFSTSKNGAQLFQTAIVDLTERERTQASLREREGELERIVNTTPFMLIRCTRDLRYRFVSPAYAKMLGRQPEDFIGKFIVEILGKAGLATIRPYIERVLSGETVSYEQVVPFRNSQPHFLRGTYVPDRDQSGAVVGWIASIVDITERKRTEAAAQRLAAVVQSSADAIAAKDLNGIVTNWNKSAERIFGYKAKEIVGKSILTIIPENRHAEETEILNRIRRGESIDHYQTVRQRKDGRLIDVSLTISPVKDAKGNIIGVSKIARDITEYKRIERRLVEQARLLDLTNEAIIVRDHKDRVTYWNRGAKELYGYSAEEAMGRVSHKLLQTEPQVSLKEIYAKLESDNRWSGELIHRRKDGTKIFVMSHWALDRDGFEERAFVLETNSDITARKIAELKLQKSKKMLERVVYQRTRALRDANTELQNEITRRKGLEGQILEISDREQERLGQELHDGLCQRLTAIAFMTRAVALRLKDHRVADPAELEKIVQLINNSVTDARNIARDLHKEEIDAAGFQDALLNLGERKIWKTPCRIRVDGDITIESDRTACEIFRILREGVINANKHSRATEIVVEACRRKRELLFSVTDNGVGLNGSGKNIGTGLGLHIMQYRAELIGARLELESPRRGGTRLAVYLPLPK
jgi:PAS domain S-box-containing protein